MKLRTAERSTKFKQTTRGIDVISSVYAFAMALGLTEVFVGSKPFLSDLIFGVKGQNDQKSWLLMFLLANVVLLGLRFFWVPRNVSALVFKAAECAVLDKRGVRGELDIANYSVAIHLVMIFAHGAIFFLLCGEFRYVAFLASSSLPLNPDVFTGYVVMHICLLLLNAAWIGFIKIQEAGIEVRAGWESTDPSEASSIWWQNNLVCGLLALAPFAVFSPCGLKLSGCSTSSNDIIGIIPASAHQLSAVFQHGVAPVVAAVVPGVPPGLACALLVLIVNSLWDLCTTGQWYLFFEDVEWEYRREEPSAQLPPRDV